MYKQCNLVHADLSEYNMLWMDGRVYIIDVSQSVEPSHPHGLELLLRDCKNVTSFFPSKGVEDVPTAHQLFNRLTGLDITAINDQEFVAQVGVINIHLINFVINYLLINFVINYLLINFLLIIEVINYLLINYRFVPIPNGSS